MQDNNLNIQFSDGFNIIKNHQLNTTGKSKCTGKAQITLCNPIYSVIQVCLFQGEKKDIDLLTLVEDLTELEVLEFEYNKEISRFYIYEILKNSVYHNECCKLIFTCSKASFYWNEFLQDAWFENWP